jgi:hypothetical protein
LRTVKGRAYDKGSFAVPGNVAHDIVSLHGKGVSLCRGNFLCRALYSLFAVRLFFVVRSDAALPCMALCRAFGGMFAVRFFFAVHDCFVPRQSNLCRATTHGRVELHGSSRFSDSACCAYGHAMSASTVRHRCVILEHDVLLSRLVEKDDS